MKLLVTIKPDKYRIKTKASKNLQKCQFTHLSKIEKNEQKNWRRLGSILESLTVQTWDKYYRYGFEVIGPLLFGFSKWLHKIAVEQRIEHLYFLSRDGYLLLKAYRNYIHLT